MRRLTMARTIPYLGLCIALFVPAAPDADEHESPLFGERIAESPFVALYVLEDLKALRKDLAQQKNELIQQIVDREKNSIDRGVDYATNTISYFFYLIAAVSSLLVLVGWTSIRDIKERVQTSADEKISALVAAYEERLHNIEQRLNEETEQIDANREEIELTQEIHSLWLRAAQETNAHQKISIYDNILSLHPRDTEALTYKADSVLELDEPQWAINLCHQALSIDSGNAHAFYQLGCANTALGNFDEAVKYLSEALQRVESYRDVLESDLALKPLKEFKPFNDLIAGSREYA